MLGNVVKEDQRAGFAVPFERHRRNGHIHRGAIQAQPLLLLEEGGRALHDDASQAGLFGVAACRIDAIEHWTIAKLPIPGRSQNLQRGGIQVLKPAIGLDEDSDGRVFHHAAKAFLAGGHPPSRSPNRVQGVGQHGVEQRAGHEHVQRALGGGKEADVNQIRHVVGDDDPQQAEGDVNRHETAHSQAKDRAPGRSVTAVVGCHKIIIGAIS